VDYAKLLRIDDLHAGRRSNPGWDLSVTFVRFQKIANKPAQVVAKQMKFTSSLGAGKSFERVLKHGIALEALIDSVTI